MARYDRYSGVFRDRDGWWVVFITDPVARLLLPLIMRLRISANALTWTSMALGAASGVLAAFNLLLAGALAYQASFVADCLDGKVARLEGTTSNYGKHLDLTADRVRMLLFQTGLSIGLIESRPWLSLAGMGMASFYLLQTLNVHIWGGVERDAQSGQPKKLITWRRVEAPFTLIEWEMFVFTVAPIAIALDAPIFAWILYGLMGSAMAYRIARRWAPR